MELMRVEFPQRGEDAICSAAALIKKDFWMLQCKIQNTKESEVGAIFLVDEILKVTDTSLRTDILTLLGQLIDGEFAQILFSSLNPALMLLTGSQRAIRYIKLPQLSADDFFNSLLKHLEAKSKQEPAVVFEYENFLRSWYYIELIIRHASGHPRNLLDLVAGLQEAEYDVDSPVLFDNFRSKNYRAGGNMAAIFESVVLALEGRKLSWHRSVWVADEQKNRTVADLVENSFFSNTLNADLFIPRMPLVWLYRFCVSYQESDRSPNIEIG